jgi:hypothetical protein
MIKPRILLLCTFAALLSSCLARKEKVVIDGAAVEGKVGSYFDTKAFFEQEVEALGDRSLIKVATNSQGQYDSTRLAEPDLAKELSFFLEFDLAHPSKVGRYSADTVNTGDGRIHLRYQASESDLKPFIVHVVQNEEDASILSVQIVDKPENVLFENSKELFYNAAEKAWNVQYSQQTSMQEAIFYHIDVETFSR